MARIVAIKPPVVVYLLEEKLSSMISLIGKSHAFPGVAYIITNSILPPRCPLSRQVENVKAIREVVITFLNRSFALCRLDLCFLFRFCILFMVSPALLLLYHYLFALPPQERTSMGAKFLALVQKFVSLTCIHRLNSCVKSLKLYYNDYYFILFYNGYYLAV